MKTLKYLKRLQILLLLTGLFLVPLLFSGMTINTILVKGLVMNTLLGGLLACAILYHGFLGRTKPLKSPLLKPSLVYFGWMILTSLRGGFHPDERNVLLQTGLLLFMAYFISVRGREMRLLHRIVMIFLAVAGVASLYAVLQILELDFFEWSRFKWTVPIRRVCSSFGNPNFFAGFLVPVIPLTIAATGTARTAMWRRLGFSLCALEIIALGLTFSKGGLIGLTVALAAYALLVLDQKKQKILGRLVPVLLVICAVSGFLWTPESGTADGGEKFVEVVMLSTGARTEIYKSTLAMIADHPILGVGPGLYMKNLPDYRTPELTLFHPPQTFLINHAHSEYLEQAAELGVPGLLLFLWIVFVALRSGLSTKGKTKLETALSFGIVAGLVGILVQNMVSVNLRKTPSMLTFWTFIGMSVCLRTPLADRSPIRNNVILRIIAIILAAWIGLSVSYSQGKRFVVDLLLREGGHELRQGAPRQGGAALSKAIRLEPGRVEGYYWLASVYFQTGDYSRAIEQFEKVLDLEGNFVNTTFNLATSYAKNKEPDKAIEYFNKALESAPYDPRVYDYLGRTYLQQSQSPENQALARDQFLKAAEYYQHESNRNPTDSGLHVERGKVLILLDNLEEAKTEFAKALQLDPDNPEAQVFVQRLGSSHRN